ncbi:MAG: hypothetical protein F2793_02560 [Actinobacteria bacterium]|uniref:Unannotated protein n=1 Tax=freshwater metagenome TaxID=449393 RepID=A0A6J7DEH4_9ZZZZ|nr:hypothetical protein [Actinomycetota bacterium]
MGNDGPVPLLILYAIVAAVNVTAELADAPGVIHVTKPLLVTVLICWLVVERRSTWDPPVTWLALGAACALAGDILLMPEGTAWFTAGLASFMAMQICYIVAFARVPGPGLVRAWRVALVPYVAYWIALMAVIVPTAGAMLVPIVVYSLCLLAMAVSALDLVIRVPQKYGWMVAIGAGLFMASDSVLALTRFGPISATPASNSMTMLTYVVAQALIIVGFARGQAVAASRSR